MGTPEEILRIVLDPSKKVSDALRQAYVLAIELRDNEKRDWIESELKGFKDEDIVPSYRLISGPIYSNLPGFGEALMHGNIKVLLPISELETIVNNNLYDEIELEPGTRINVRLLINIIEAVRTNLIEWLTIEKNKGTMANGSPNFANRFAKYKVLIASPSDMIEERKNVLSIFHSWNAINSEEYHVILEPVMWEIHSVPTMGERPQAIINKQIVEPSHLLIGFFWTRIGTHTGVAESGTVEEIERFIAAGKPVMLYFSSTPIDPKKIDVDQYKRLLDFKEKYKQRGLIDEYETIAELREKLMSHLTMRVRELKKSLTNQERKD